MADRTASLMKGLDAPRPIPPRMRERLEGAVVASTLVPEDENLLYILDRPKRLPAAMQQRLVATLTGEDEADIAERMALLNTPYPIPEAMRARLMNRLMMRGGTGRMVRIAGAAAVAILVVAGTFAITFNRGGGTGPDGNDGQAIKPSPSSTASVLGEKFTQEPTVKPRVANPKPTLDVKGVRIPTRGDGPTSVDAPGTMTPDTQPTGGIPPLIAGPASARDRNADRADAPAASLNLLNPVLNLVRDLLAALNVNDSARPAPQVTAPAAPTAPTSPAAPKKSASTKRTTKPKTAAVKPKTASPAQEPKPLLTLPLLGGSGGGIIEIPVVEITLSL